MDETEYIKSLKQLNDLGLIPKSTQKELVNIIEQLDQKKESNDHKLKIKFINKSENENPKYAKVGDSGFDLRSSEGGEIKPMERKLISTGLFFELPDGYEMLIRPRSGLALKHGITVLNTPGTVDTGYIGEIKVLLINLGQEAFKWEKGERIAQAVIAPRVSSDFGELIEVEEITESERGSDGFGSTGTK